MLLIVGGESDPNTQRVVDQAHIRDLAYYFLNTDEPDSHRIAWDFEKPELTLSQTTVRPTAVFLRYNVFAGVPATNLAAFDVVQSFSLAWPDINLLNRRTTTDLNNKSKNLRLAIDVGFEIPDTLVMGNLSPLATMPDPQSRIIKPLGGGAHTQSVDKIANDPQQLAMLGPQFVQSRLSGENLRIFSIGGNQFCFHLESDALDYREDAGVDVKLMPVPPALIDPTRELVERIGFDYCALDFRCKESFVDPVFLEINSFPMFVRFDDAGENCLVDAMLDFLTT
tara:strand:+ start:48033 stop:48878 length:846 start_codon:yes stop_codon:yes gene_type:complete